MCVISHSQFLSSHTVDVSFPLLLATYKFQIIFDNHSAMLIVNNFIHTVDMQFPEKFSCLLTK
jgi:hypothetical protein